MRCIPGVPARLSVVLNLWHTSAVRRRAQLARTGSLPPDPAGRTLAGMCGARRMDCGACPQKSRSQRALLRFRVENLLQTTCELRANRTECAALLLAFGLCSPMAAQPVGAPQEDLASPPVARAGLAEAVAVAGRLVLPGVGEAGRNATAQKPPATPGQLIVIGFMGGNVGAGNMVHREALVARELQQRFPHGLHAAVFANSDWKNALRTVLQLLDANGNGRPSAGERSAARIVIYGHSWGASETVTLARRLDQLGIPVLLTIQIDSVEKLNENDGSIPPNVREAVNFYQTEGLLHGRSSIAAMDPKQTTILGNYESSYRGHPVSCAGYPWFARAFMKPHIEIENDPLVWSRVEGLIRKQMP